MRVGETVERLRAQLRGEIRRHRTHPVGESLQGLAVDEFHHHHEDSVLLTQLVQRRDRRMVQLREGDRFGPEALQRFGLGHVPVQDFDRDLALQRIVDGAVDGAHAAASEPVEDSVFADRTADHLGNSGVY